MEAKLYLSGPVRYSLGANVRGKGLLGSKRMEILTMGENASGVRGL